MKKFISGLISLICMILFITPSASAGSDNDKKLSVAVAANFINPFKELADVFEKKTGIKVEATFSSSGNLYGQIAKGAPYDIFLSADEERPARLLKENLGEKPFVYARGQVILWSAEKKFCSTKNWKEAVKKGTIKKLAIANPDTAPYGLAAKTALEKVKLYDILKDKIVTAQSVAQSFQYASTGAVDAGFCAFSAAFTEEGKKGCFYKIKDAPEITQSACILKRTEKRKTAEQFASFLMSKEAAKIKVKYGYK